MSEEKQSANPVLDTLSQLANERVEGGTQEVLDDIKEQQQMAADAQTPVQNEEPTSETSESQTVNDGDSGQEPDHSTSEDNAPTEETTQETPWFEKDDDSFTNDDDPTDYSTLINDLGFEGSSKSDILSNVQSLKEQNQELTEKVKTFEESNPYANDDLKTANELAKNGGDWQQYLNISSTDWDAIDDQTLVVEMKLREVFGDDVEAMKEHLQNMGPYEVKIQGKQIRDSLKADQQTKMREVQEAAVKKKRDIDNKIKNTLDNVKEMYGVKMTPALKTQMFKDITGKGGLINSIFYDKAGNLNPKAIIETAFAAKHMKMIMQVNMNRYKNQGKEEILNEVSNPTRRANGEFSNPEPKQQTPLDGFLGHIQKNGPF